MAPRRIGVFAIVGVVLIAVIAAVKLLVLAPAATGTGGAVTGAPAPQIALPVVGGGTSNLAGEKGKVVLLNFWATWCEPCKSEMPALQRLADELRDRPFRLYSVDLQEDAQDVEAFQRQYNLHLYAVLDSEGDAVRAYGVRALPSTFLVDQRGILRLQRIGPLLEGGPEVTWSEAWLADQVRQMLAAS